MPIRPTHWSILIRVDQNNILAPIRSFLWELSVLAILILLPLLGLVLGMIKTLHEEWSSTKREFQRAADAETALKRRTEALHALVAAAQRLASQQDLDELLHQLLHLAKENTGARYAALGVYDGNTRVAIQFLTAGNDDAAARAIRLLPFEQLSRESLGQGDSALRLAHLTAHSAALGLPVDRYVHDVVSRRSDSIPGPILRPPFSCQQSDCRTGLRTTSANWTNRLC